MKKIILFLLIILGMGVFAPEPRASGHLRLAGGASTTSLSDSTSATTHQSKYAIVGGAAVGLHVAPKIALETGAWVLSRNYVATGYSVQTRWIAIPLEGRFQLLPSVNVGAGPYYAIASGNVSARTHTTKTFTYSALGLKEGDFGVTGSVYADLLSLKVVSVFVEARYSSSVANAAKTGTLKYSDAIALIGLRLGEIK